MIIRGIKVDEDI